MEATSKTVSTDQIDTIIGEILATVAEKDQCDLTALPSLYETIDPDALSEVVHGIGVQKVAFTYHGYSVRVDSEGHVNVRPSKADAQ